MAVVPHRIQAPPVRVELLSEVDRLLAELALGEAAALVAGYSGDPESERAVAKVASRLGAEWGAAGLRWFDSLVDGDVKGRAVEVYFSAWAERDIESVKAWLGGQDASPYLDRAIEGYIGVVAPFQPEEAVHWAASVHDDDLRDRSTFAALRVWRRTDEVSALRWFQGTDYPLEVWTDVINDRGVPPGDDDPLAIPR